MGGPGGPPIGPPCTEIEMGGPGGIMGGPWGASEGNMGGPGGTYKKRVSVEKDVTIHTIRPLQSILTTSIHQTKH